MTKERQQQIVDLAIKTANRLPLFIYEGGYTDTEIEFFLKARADLNVKYTNR